MINYPKELDTIFNTLLQNNLQIIIVGGFIRDSLLKIQSKDIDIEVYKLSSYKELEKLLRPFGDVNSVGKSFGVCKLKYKNFDLDFSMPREDSKVGYTHKEFSIKTYSHIDFKKASSRRDFTINAIGYNIATKKLLDPHNGIDDLHNKKLKAIHLEKFKEDPLRVLRAMQFSARFELDIDTELFMLCKDMVQKDFLYHLPKERIYEEFKKLFLKAQKPSIGLLFLQNIGAFTYFNELQSSSLLQQKYNAIDALQSKEIELYLTLLCFDKDEKETISLISKLSNEKKLLKNILTLHKFKNLDYTLDEVSNTTLYKLAQDVNISHLVSLKRAFKSSDVVDKIEIKAKELGIYTQKLPPILRGRDLIQCGLKPSRKFSSILDKAYRMQMEEKFSSHRDAILWLKKILAEERG